MTDRTCPLFERLGPKTEYCIATYSCNGSFINDCEAERYKRCWRYMEIISKISGEKDLYKAADEYELLAKKNGKEDKG